jgi:hypothetical protein
VKYSFVINTEEQDGRKILNVFFVGWLAVSSLGQLAICVCLFISQDLAQIYSNNFGAHAETNNIKI